MASDVNVKVDINFSKLNKKFNNHNNNAIRILKSEISKDTESYVPFRTGSLRRSVYFSLRTNDFKLIWNRTYARFLYYGKVMIGKISKRAWAKKGETKEVTSKDLTYSQGGAKWFERAKACNLKKWIRVAKKVYNQ